MSVMFCAVAYWVWHTGAGGGLIDCSHAGSCSFHAGDMETAAFFGGFYHVGMFQACGEVASPDSGY